MLTTSQVKDKFRSIKPIALSGVARSGKDSFCALLIEYLASHGIKAKRFALADRLKLEIDPFLMSSLGISAFTQITEEKNLIRPLLVAYGKAKRIRSKAQHWTGMLTPDVLEAIENGIVPIITDVRYAEYESDEINWINDTLGGYLVHISRIAPDGTLVQPPNVDEAKNDPIVAKAAFHRVVWETFPDVSMTDLGKYVEEFIEKL